MALRSRSSTSLLLALFALPPAQEGPPGLVPVPGGKTRMGSKVEQVEPLIQAREDLAWSLAGETPQFTADVSDFFLMPTEVTNEQYAHFVRASGARPPRSWGEKALEAGRLAFLDQQGQRKQQARAAGELFEPQVFDPESWWQAHWKEARWDIPLDEMTRPVVYVTYADAQHYARWAGLRLMTEFEFARAARGDSERTYPWGDDWDDGRHCQSLHAGKDQSAPVGSYPEGAVNGIFDLAGNVWEWTSSPYDPFPGYKPFNVQVGTGSRRRVVEALAGFDAYQRVVVSGSFQMDRIGVRLTTRKDSERSQSTNALGFRCAASPTPGLDAARWILDQDIRRSALPREAEFAPALAFALRRWTTAASDVPVPGYAVISGYEHVLFCPVQTLPASSPGDLAKHTAQNGPLFLGFVDLPRPLVEPELDGGTYLVAWRGAGKLAPKESSEQRSAQPGREGFRLDRTRQEGSELPLDQVPGFDSAQDCYLFFSAEGVPQVALRAPEFTVERMRPGTVAIEPASSAAQTPQPLEPGEPLDTLRFTIPIASVSQRSKAFVFDLSLRVKAGSFDASFR